MNFIDKALANEDAVAVPLYKGGLAALEGVAQARHGAGFAGLGAAQQDEILAALESGKLGAAGIDAYNNEPNIDPRLIAFENTFLMPHIGSATAETRDAMGYRALDNLDAFFAGREPKDRVA